MRTFALLCLAGAARAVTLNCGGLVGGSGEFVAVDDVVFTDEGVCEKTCGACSSPNGPMTCAPASGTLSEFRCAEADASGALSFAIVVTPTVDVSCEDVAGLKFEAGCAAACASCSSADAPKMCAKGVCAAFEKPDIAVDPFSRTDAVSKELPAVPQMKTITFGTDV